ncbi:tRNA pseudouridine(55) synthase TruB [Patescibacteria group bacterium]|nr:MAG: tRNA pseudouridine(55) synthase TruB [Patescibacteria group bacterium]
MVGFLLIDKPAGPTSHDIVDAVRRVTGEKRVGHAGTLDPFATGLLIVGVGREATREFPKLVGLDKTYEATMVLGATSDTQDRTGRIEPTVFDSEVAQTRGAVSRQPSADELRDAFMRFTGTIRQTPPMYSAKKVGGRKLYELARQGIEVAREPVDVIVHALELLSHDPPRATIRVSCSSGTYIRTLAHDIGQALGCGAYLETLRRTKIGPFDLSSSVPLATLTKDAVSAHLQPVSTILSHI